MNISPSLSDPRASQRLDILGTLAPARRAMGLARTAHSTLLGLAAGAAAGAAALVAAHVWPFGLAVPGTLWVSLLAVAVGLVAGLAVGLARWPGPQEAARAADLHFGLDDRLTTALELQSSNSAVAVLQSRDAARHVDGLALSQSRGRWLRRGEAAGIALATLAFVGALALGPPARAHHATTASDAQRRAQAAARRAAAAQIQHLTAKLQAGLTPDQRRSANMRKLDLALARLRRQLLQASTPRAALRAVSATQQQLRQLAAGLHPINTRAVAQLNSSLGRYLGNRSAGVKQKTSSSTRSAQAMAQALNRLAQSLAHLSPAQRAALARALAQAANNTSNNGLRSSLRQAASALANQDRQAASAALQQAAQALARSLGAQSALSRLGAANSQLSSLKNQLSGITGQIPSSATTLSPTGQQRSQPGGSRSGAGQQGRQSSPGQGARAGKGSGRGLGFQSGRGRGNGRGLQAGRGRGNGFLRGRAGRGTGQGRGTAGQTGTPARSGQGTSGARGSGGQGRSSSTRPGRKVTVFVLARQGKGQEIVQNGPNGAPEQGNIVPYQQVVGRYAQSAHQALDRSALPPSLQGYVRRYFSTISR